MSWIKTQITLMMVYMKTWSVPQEGSQVLRSQKMSSVMQGNLSLSLRNPTEVRMMASGRLMRVETSQMRRRLVIIRLRLYTSAERGRQMAG